MALSPKRFNGIALAAGAGGLELGISLAVPNYRTVCFVERDAYAAATLVARMEDTALDKAPVWSDLTTFSGEEWRGKVDIITAGYPCQPFSQAGKRLGEKDPRHLWPHIRQILEESEAPFLFVENVLGHVSLGLENVRADLLAMGYSLEAGIFSAAEVGAPHIRKRLFLLAYSNSMQFRLLASYCRKEREALLCGARTPNGLEYSDSGMDASLQGRHGESTRLFPPHASEFESWESWLALRPELQPAVPGGTYGMAHKLDRYRLTGNGVCPLAAGYAFSTLLANAEAKIDNSKAKHEINTLRTRSSSIEPHEGQRTGTHGTKKER